MNYIFSEESPDFKDIKVAVKTKFNDGNVIGYYNKCFFIALADGLKENNINVEPQWLMSSTQMFNHIMVDTFYEDHRNMIEYLAGSYGVRIDFYIGVFDDTDNEWYCTPDPQYTVNASSKKIVKIINKPLHFEHIIFIGSREKPELFRNYDFSDDCYHVIKENDLNVASYKDQELFRNYDFSDDCYHVIKENDLNVVSYKDQELFRNYDLFENTYITIEEIDDSKKINSVTVMSPLKSTNPDLSKSKKITNHHEAIKVQNDRREYHKNSVTRSSLITSLIATVLFVLMPNSFIMFVITGILFFSAHKLSSMVPIAFLMKNKIIRLSLTIIALNFCVYPLLFIFSSYVFYLSLLFSLFLFSNIVLLQ